MEPGFTLRKWYLDCVSDEGEAAIAYCAELRWKALVLRYSSVLQHDEARGTRVRSSLRACPEPRVTGPELSWDAPPLGLSGSWRAQCPPADATLLDGPEGAVRWHCLQPRARAELRLPDGRTLSGLGYCELLTLTLPPWRLPIDELRWGRFVSPSDGLVWIDWRGPRTTQLVLRGATPVGPAEIDEPGVRAGEVELQLSHPRVLRSGRIGETALSILPDLASLFPGRIIGLFETKWLSRGALGGEEGYAIHEVVKWPR